MIENAGWLDVLGVAGVAIGLFAAIRAYLHWWLASDRALKTAAKINGYTGSSSPTAELEHLGLRELPA